MQSLLNLVHPKELPTETKVFSSASLSKTMQRDTRTQEVATHLLIASPKLSSPRFEGNGSLVGSAHSAFSRVTFSKDRNFDRPLTQHLEILPGLEVRKPFLPHLCISAHESISPKKKKPSVPFCRRNENATQLAQPLLVNFKMPDAISYPLQGKKPIKIVVVSTNNHSMDDDDISSIGSDSDSECFFLASPGALHSVACRNTLSPRNKGFAMP